MIKEPFKKLGTFDNTKLLANIKAENRWRFCGASIAKEVKHAPFNDLKEVVAELVQEHIDPLYAPFTYFYRVHNLQPGKKITPHVDSKVNIPCVHMIHFIAQSNPKADFTIDDETFNMEEGGIYEINYSYIHSALNRGSTDRIHLLVELRCS